MSTIPREQPDVSHCITFIQRSQLGQLLSSHAAFSDDAPDEVEKNLVLGLSSSWRGRGSSSASTWHSARSD